MINAMRKPKYDWVLRLADADDLPACAAICNDYIDETEWLPRVVTVAEIEAMFAPSILETRKMILAEMNGEIVGYMSINMPENHLVAFYLRPHVRGEGIGKAMFDRAKQLLPDGFELNVFEINRDAQRFYHREGLYELPEGRDDNTDEGIPTLRMRWNGGTA